MTNANVVFEMSKSNIIEISIVITNYLLISLYYSKLITNIHIGSERYLFVKKKIRETRS